MNVYNFEVYATAFHGGRFISKHRTREAAERAVKNYRMHDCVCGCAGIIDTRTEQPGSVADQDQYNNPYAVGRV